jgi:hypothetical protein
MQQLATIFGSEARIKIMRLFLLNSTEAFDVAMVAQRAAISTAVARRELGVLKKAGFLKPKSFSKQIISRKKKKSVTTQGFIFSDNFAYKDQFEHLLVDADFIKSPELIAQFKKAGKIKFLVMAGIFLRDDEGRVDLCIVGDKLNRKLIDNSIHKLEAEIGKELSYAVFDTAEFKYRLEMYDKLVCDIFEYPHETLVDTGGWQEKISSNHLR